MQPSPTEQFFSEAEILTEKSQRDRQILTIRRLDWRFLLPDPRLENVAYIGAPAADLIAALEAFSSRLTNLADVNSAAKRIAEPQFDVLVASRAKQAEIEAAMPLLKPDGFLYWEVERSKLDGAAKFRSVFSYRKYLKKLKFDDIQIYWHRPNFVACKEIIPLENPAALNFAFTKGHVGLKGRAKEFAGKWLKTSGFLSFSTPCFSFIGKKWIE